MPPYVIVPEKKPIDQGEIVESCPIINWVTGGGGIIPGQDGDWSDALFKHAENALLDVVILTQSCDLAQNKAPFVTLCAVNSLDRAKEEWLAAKSITPSDVDRRWKDYLRDVNNDKNSSYAYLPSGSIGEVTIPARLVSFYPTFTLPYSFLHSYVEENDKQRLRLNSPFRERLSYRFATLYARIGVEDVDKLSAGG